ncbi:MAG: RdgB/HAM1 family non-canonical purine NTP pyrophosphatase [Microscillaceae bacterium]|jgi:XTP/dITP diphosphohydrolase|nr:RdgB/HAM1 family non-canonical purine NTP pyrophosphatase [Microscillaceae bacterium]
MQLCFASRNEHKLAEIQAIVGDKFEIIGLDAIGCTAELPETTDTIEGNSHQKARYIWEHFGVDCFADDSGLLVDALNGEPGVHTAYYSGSRVAEDNINFLLHKLAHTTQRQAHFKSVITLIIKGIEHQFTGIVEGEVLLQKRGEGGFGYDPIFLPQGYTQSFAEMTMEEKNPISHRGRALQQLVDFLTKYEK